MKATDLLKKLDEATPPSRERVLVQYRVNGNTAAAMGNVKLIPKLEAGVYSPQPTMEGLFFERKDVLSDGLLRFEDERQDTILQEVAEFWKLKDSYAKYEFVHSRGMVLYGPPGSGKCLGKGTPVMMFDGTIKPVEDVVVGDKLMGDDSSPRNVLSIARGREKLYRVIPVKGDSYVCNESHIISLQCSGDAYPEKFVDIEIRDYLRWSEGKKSRYKGYRVPVDFSEQPVPIDPYFLGIWLGDGVHGHPRLALSSESIIEWLFSYAESLNMSVTVCGASDIAAKDYRICGEGKGHANPILDSLRGIGVINNKHVPHVFKSNSKKVRQEILAGLLDTDGHMSAGCIDFITKYETLRDDVLFLCRSLGFAAYWSRKFVRLEGWEKEQEYFRISISGDFSEMPFKHLKAPERKQIKDVLLTGITVEELDVGDYYGFEIDGNRRFLLGDFTVTHNTCLLKLVMEQMVNDDSIVLLGRSPSSVREGLKIIREVEPDRKVCVVMEDFDEMARYDEHGLLELLDGEEKVGGVLYLGTTNFLERIPARLLRPPRFDRKIEVPFPPMEGRLAYLRGKLGQHQDESDVSKLAEMTDGLSFGHLRELIVSVYCLGHDVQKTIERLRGMGTVGARSSDADRPLPGAIACEARERVRKDIIGLKESKAGNLIRKWRTL